MHGEPSCHAAAPSHGFGKSRRRQQISFFVSCRRTATPGHSVERKRIQGAASLPESLPEKQPHDRRKMRPWPAS
ncbi:hypothetical protein U9M48_029566 [Paspalum notatum var. saurae]|uniref:Uncharacterized protein n=1 Tax=Paspalum notatum var. saurae TaxID=547442 RepID=A0AAQ3X2T9_PASNO